MRAIVLVWLFLILVLLLMVLLLPSPAHGQALPDAPQPSAARVNFWTIHPNRTNRQTLTSPWFLAPEIAMWSTGIAAYKRRAIPWSKTDAFVPLAAMTGFHYLSDRWLARWIGMGESGAVIGINLAGIITRHPR